jgi:hypothetical protein
MKRGRHKRDCDCEKCKIKRLGFVGQQALESTWVPEKTQD